MSIQELEEGIEVLQTHEEDVIEALTFYCNMLWQDASAYTRNKYPQYAMKEEVLKNKFTSTSMQRIGTLLDTAVTLIECATGIEDLDEFDSEDVALVGNLLRISSFVNVLFGGEAALGDVEFFVRKIHKEFSFRKTGSTPHKAFRAYMRGDGLEFLDYMYWRMKSSLKIIKRIRKVRLAGRPMLNGGPSIWVPGPQGYEIDQRIYKSDYHLHVSLLKYLENPAGSA